jgi:iron complex transport system substrate-binding protein
MMNQRSLSVFFSLLVAAMFLLSACAAQPTPQPTPTLEPTPSPIVLKDGLDREITLAAPAQRVVSLAASNTEILYAIGAGEQVVGRDEFSNYPEEAASLPTVGGSFGGYNNEAIVALNPDLVLAAGINTPDQVQALEDLGLTVFYLANPVTMDEMYQSLLTVAALTGRTAETEALIETLKTRVAVVVEKVAGLDTRPTVFYELDSTDPSAPYTAGAGTFIDTLITMAGGTNIGAAMDAPWGQLSIEQIVADDPQIILLGDAAYGVTIESVGERAGWESLQAVTNNRIYAFNDDLVSRPGPRLVDGLETLFGLLHP